MRSTGNMIMIIDIELLQQFEKNLNPQDLSKSKILAQILGYGEISSIFQLAGDGSTAYKRMPLFKSKQTALEYESRYKEYCTYLKKAGLQLPEDETTIIEPSKQLTVLYIAQQRYPPDKFCHKLIHILDFKNIQIILEKIVFEIEKVWEFNQKHKSKLELSLDGQLSNWVFLDNQLYFVDTSTPLFKKSEIEQLDPDLLLQSAPGFLRWILRLFFLDDVMNRYYDRRQVFIDLAANLYKEQKVELIPMTIEIINNNIPSEVQPLTEKEVEKYYKEDKIIWTLFLNFRRIDRWLTTKLFRKRYEFILPGKIKR